jgi:hypothetical protein
MTTLYVGQRIKRVRGQANLGLIGTVVELGLFESPRHPVSKACDIRVRYDTEWKNTQGKVFPKERVAYGDQADFEPLVPEGHSKSSWANCAWKPEGYKDGNEDSNKGEEKGANKGQSEGSQEATDSNSADQTSDEH